MWWINTCGTFRLLKFVSQWLCSILHPTCLKYQVTNIQVWGCMWNKKAHSLQVKSAVPEGGVCGLQEDSRIIGLIYTAKMNKNKRWNSVLKVCLDHTADTCSLTNHLNNFHCPLVSVCKVQELLKFDNYFCNLFNPSVWQNEESLHEQITNIYRLERQHGVCGAGIVGLLVILKS